MSETGDARIAELGRMRDLMGTSPRKRPNFETRFYRGVEGIRVQLIDGPRNPYKAMYCMAVSTWGAGEWSTEEARILEERVSKYGYRMAAIERRWEDAEPEMRFAVVNSTLAFQALPLAMEHPKFMFAIENLSRWSFDQIVRARLGVVYASLGTRDNCHLDMAFRMHDASFRDPVRRRSFVENGLATKERYRDVVGAGKGSWQEARTWLPISVVHRFCMSINYAALRTMCSRRMTFSEAEDTVAVAWLLRDRLMKLDGYPLLARWLRPKCDFAGACQYHQAHTPSEAFGCLFESCGRNPVRSAPGNPSLDYAYAEFNEVCTDEKALTKQLGISIPSARFEVPRADDPVDVLMPTDKYLFGFNGIYKTPMNSSEPSGMAVDPMDADAALAAPAEPT